MRKTAKEIIVDVEEHLTKSNKRYYSDFYVGITNDIERRLFVEHNVEKKKQLVDLSYRNKQNCRTEC
ncbi:hypothetical protein ACIXHS_11635 [Bacteroides fragilis]